MITLIVGILVLALIYWLVSLLPIPEPFDIIIKVIFIIIAILMVLNAFGLVTGISIR